MMDIYDIINKWHTQDFESDEEKMLFYIQHSETIKNEYWDTMPEGLGWRPHPWDD